MGLGRLPRRARRDDGFTLIELMLVLVIVGILIGAGAPTFLTASQRASEARAETNLRTATKVAWTYVVQYPEGFAGTPAALSELGDVEPALTWVSAGSASTDPTVVSVAEDADGQELALATRSSNGVCVYVRLSLVTVESRHTDDTALTCRAIDYVDGPNTGW